MIKRAVNPESLTVKKARVLYELGFMTEEEAKVYFKPTGVSDNDVSALLKLSWQPMRLVIASEWKAQAEEVVGRLKEGEIDRTTAWKLLQDIGYSSVEADITLDYLMAE